MSLATQVPAAHSDYLLLPLGPSVLSFTERPYPPFPKTFPSEPLTEGSSWPSLVLLLSFGLYSLDILYQ